MATQRITLAKISGASGTVIARLMQAWSQDCRKDACPAEVRRAVDEFVVRLKAHSAELPVTYYCEWIDRWLMGDEFKGRLRAWGDRCDLIVCFSREQALRRARSMRRQSHEQRWLATRLKECATAFDGGADFSAILLIRETYGPTAIDEEYRIAVATIPEWMESESTPL